MMTKVAITLSFKDSGYIGKPYWPETNRLIDISKLVNPRLGEAKKGKALEAACEKHGLTMDDYHNLEAASARPFYTVGGVRTEEIVIPQRVIQSFINHSSKEAPKKVIPTIPEKGLTFIAVKIEGGYLTTGKTEKDAKLFERFVKNSQSNQRMWSADAYIIEFDAEGILLLDEEIIKSEDLHKLFKYGGKMHGIGSARPQGFGRFDVTRWDVL